MTTNWVEESSADAPSASGTDWEQELYPNMSISTQKAYRSKVPGALEKRERFEQESGKLPINYAPSKGAALLDLIGAGTADSPEYQVRYFASKRFPDLPIEEAMSRYGFSNGEIFYLGEDNKLYSEAPRLLDRFFMSSSKALPIVGGLVSGAASAPMILTGPGGFAGSVAITGTGAGLGEAARQKIGQELTGDPFSVGEIATEGGLAASGQFVGGLISKFLSRGIARDLSKMDPDEAKVLADLGRKYNIDLTPAEVTNLPSLKAQQKALGNIVDSADEMADFYSARASQVDDAVAGMLNKISTVDSPEVAGQLVRSAAKNAMKDVAEQRAAMASPIYKRAFRNAPEVNTDNVIDLIDGEIAHAKGGIKSALEKVRSFFVEDVAGEEVKDTTLVGMHNAKLAIDDMIDSARETGLGRVTKGKLVAIKNALLKEMDSVSPEYKHARQIFSDLSPLTNDVREGIIGIIADLPDTKLQTIAAKLFNPKAIGPITANKAKQVLRAADPEGWQALKRAWLQTQWNTASKDFATAGNLNRGAKYRALLFGDKQSQELLKVMLDKEEYALLEELGKVLQATGRVQPVGSDTAWNQELMRIERSNAGNKWSAIAKTIRVTGWPKLMEDWATEKSMAGNAEKMARLITSQNAMKNLKALKEVSPSSARAAVITAHFLGLGAEAGANVIKEKVLED